MTAYLDNASTTRLRPEAAGVLRAAAEGELWGNPSGSHAVSRSAKNAVEVARETMADALGFDVRSIVFTSGGTESDNLAIAGVLRRRPGRPVCGATEHPAVLEACRALGGTIVDVRSDGTIDLDALAGALGADVSVVSIMTVNNETGVVNDIGAISRVVRAGASGAALHTDAVQAFPLLDVAALTRDADLVSVSAHKFGGPQGIGVLAVRDPSVLSSTTYGGGQERDLRSGTHNVGGIVAMAEAARATVRDRAGDAQRLGRMRDRLVDGVLAAVPGCVETVNRESAAPSHAHLRIAGVESEELLLLLDGLGVYASAGSACASGAIEPSHVLLAMGIDSGDALSSLRLTLGYDTSDAEIDRALAAIPEAVDRLRQGNPGRQRRAS